MRHERARFFQVVLTALLMVLMTVSVIHSPGTTDVLIWKRWMANLDAFGLAAGFQANHADYPPYSSVILFSANRIARVFGVGAFGAIKLSILVFLILTSVLFWLWTRDIILTLVLHVSLLLNSVALGYIDIFVAPSLILALWALQKRHWLAFAIFYSTACLTKWQPLIIAPFILVYVLNIRDVAQWRNIPYQSLMRQVLGPALAILVLTGSVFGFIALAQSFANASSHTSLSGNALNFNWVMTHWLHVFFPERFGGLVAGRADLVYTRSPALTLGPRLFFLVCYAMTLLTFFRHKKGFEDLLYFSLTGYLAYFIFNTGVHENHIFLVTVLAALLCWLNKDHALLMAIVLLMSNLNMFIFYGIDGTGLMFSRVLAGRVDMALVLAMFNVMCFLALGWLAILRDRTASGATSSLREDGA